MFTGISLIT